MTNKVGRFNILENKFFENLPFCVPRKEIAGEALNIYNLLDVVFIVFCESFLFLTALLLFYMYTRSLQKAQFVEQWTWNARVWAKIWVTKLSLSLILDKVLL